MDFKNGIDISLPFRSDRKGVSAWYVDPMMVRPVMGNGFIGSVGKGGSVNFNDLTFNPHGNGTHTECVGHITLKGESVNKHLTQWMFDALLISVQPAPIERDMVITKSLLQKAIGSKRPEALVLRTTPNPPKKKSRDYSNSNPPYLEAAGAAWLAEIGVDHILIDLPSVDREVDGGVLAAHHAFWCHPENTRFHATITELVYVPISVEDGEYLLNLQVAPIENDASPSRPVLYKKVTY